MNFTIIDSITGSTIAYSADTNEILRRYVETHPEMTREQKVSLVDFVTALYARDYLEAMNHTDVLNITFSIKG